MAMPDNLDLSIAIDKDGREGAAALSPATTVTAAPSAALPYYVEPLSSDLLDKIEQAAENDRQLASRTKFDSFAQDLFLKEKAQQEFDTRSAMILMDAAEKMDRPFNSLRTGLQEIFSVAGEANFGFLSPVLPKGERRKLFEEARQVSFKNVPKAFVAGWKREVSPSWADVAGTAAFGRQFEPVVEEYLANRGKMRVTYRAIEFASDVVGDSLIEYFTIGSIARAATRGISMRLPEVGKSLQLLAPKRYARAFAKKPDIIQRAFVEGFSEAHAKIIMDSMNTYAFRKGFREALLSIDDMTLNKIQKKFALHLAKRGWSGDIIETAVKVTSMDEIMLRSILGDSLDPKIIGGTTVISPLGITAGSEKYWKMADYLKTQIDSAAKNTNDLYGQLDNVVKEKVRLDSVKGAIDFDSPDLGSVEYGLLDELDTLYRTEKMLAEELIPRSVSYQKMLGDSYGSLISGKFRSDLPKARQTMIIAYLDKLITSPKGTARFEKAGLLFKTISEKGKPLQQAYFIKKTAKGGKRLTLEKGIREVRNVTKDKIEKTMAAVSDGRLTNYDDLHLLSDVELESLVEYVDDFFLKPSEDFPKLPLFLSKAWRQHPTPPLAKLVAPIHYTLRRMGFGAGVNIKNAAQVAQTNQSIRLLDQWKMVGGDRIDDAVNERLAFLLDGKTDDYVRLAKNLSPGQLTKDASIAAQFNKMRDEFKDIFLLQGKLVSAEEFARTGKGTPVIKDYITWLQKEFIESKDYKIEPFLQSFNKTMKTHIDISLLRRRIQNITPENLDVDWAYRTTTLLSSWNANMEPALVKIQTMADLTGDKKLIDVATFWVNHHLRGLPTQADISFENNIAGPIKELLEKGTVAFPERLRYQAKVSDTKKFLGWYTRANYFGGLGYNPSPVAKQVVQNMMNIPFADTSSWLWGLQSMFTDGGEALSKHNNLLTSRLPFEDIDPRAFTKVEKGGTWLFRKMDKINVKAGGNSFLYHFVKQGGDDNLRFLKNFGDFKDWRDVDGTSKAIAAAMDVGYFSQEKAKANLVIKINQYGYKAGDLPYYMVGIGKPLGQFSSWWSNYLYSYLPQLLEMSFTGKTPWGEVVDGWSRHAFLRHYMIAESVSIAGSMMGFDLKGHQTVGLHIIPTSPAKRGESLYSTIRRHSTFLPGASPTRIPPLAAFVSGMVQWYTGEGIYNKGMIKNGLSLMNQGLLFAPPVIVRKGIDVFGGKDVKSLIAPLKKEDDTGWDYIPMLSPPGISGPSYPR